MHGKEKTVWIFQTVSEQRYRDSNPNIQSQSLLCYLYTIPLCVVLELSVGFSRPLCSRRVLLYHNGFCLSTPFLKKVEKILDFFRGRKGSGGGGYMVSICSTDRVALRLLRYSFSVCRIFPKHSSTKVGTHGIAPLLSFKNAADRKRALPAVDARGVAHPWELSPTQLQKRRRLPAGAARHCPAYPALTMEVMRMLTKRSRLRISISLLGAIWRLPFR